MCKSQSSLAGRRRRERTREGTAHLFSRSTEARLGSIRQEQLALVCVNPSLARNMPPCLRLDWALGVLLLLGVVTFSDAQCELPDVTVEQFGVPLPLPEISVTIGARVSLDCVEEFMAPSSPAVDYLWQRNGITIEGPGTVSQLTIESLQTSDGGVYRCGVVFDCGSDRETVYSADVVVNTPAVITQLNDATTGGDSTTVTEGDSFELACYADGYPQPNIEWLHPNGSLVATGNTYTNPSASLSDSGVYTCRAVNRYIDTETHTVLVEEPEQPTSTSSSVRLPSPSASATVEAVLPTQTEVYPSASATVEAVLPTQTEESQVVLPSPTDLVPIPTDLVPIPTDMVPITTDMFPIPTDMVLFPGSGFGSETPVDDSEDDDSTPLLIFLAVIAFVGVLIIFTVMLMILVLWLCYIEMKGGPKNRRGVRNQVVDEIKLLEQGPDGDEEMDGGAEVEQNGAVLGIVQPLVVNEAFVASSGSEGPGVRVAASQEEPHPPQALSKSTKEPDHGQQERVKEATHPAVEQVPPQASVNVPKKKGRRRADQPEEGEQLVKVRAKREGGKAPRSASTGDPRAARKQQEVRDQRSHQRRSSAERTTAHLPAKPTQKAERDRTSISRERPKGKERPREGDAQGGREKVRVKQRSRPDGAERETGQKAARAHARKSTGGDVARKQQQADTRPQQRSKTAQLTAAAPPETKPGSSEKRAGERRRKKGGEKREGGKAKEKTSSLVITEKAGEVIVAMEEPEPLVDEEPPSSDEEVTPAPALPSWEQEGGEPEKTAEAEAGEKEEPQITEDKEEDKEEKEEEKEDKREGEDKGKGVQDLPQEEKGAIGKDQEDDDSIAQMAVFVEKAKKLGRTVSFVKQLDRSHPLTVPQILEVVELIDAADEDQDHALLAEYNSVPHNSVQTLPLSPAEKQKNRYRNVLPNPHSAVKLSDTGDDGSTYINANFIRGLNGKEKAFIATQGPTENTVGEFWRMVWEHDVSIIVMTTGLVERGTIKCTRYWPPAHDTSPVTYGDIVVRNNYEENTAFYKIAYLTVCPKSRDGEPGVERDVYHFWYTAWPDFGVPRESISILRLREAVNTFRESESGPILTHCSAGLGRSGTFMAIDMGIQQFQMEGVVDPLKYMCEMRQDRGGIIQTPAQYAYVHRVLADYMASRQS